MAGKGRRPLIGGAWVAQLKVRARSHDIVHVHSASTLAHSRLGAPRFVLHCHGTDVRTAQYEPAGRRPSAAACATPKPSSTRRPTWPNTCCRTGRTRSTCRCRSTSTTFRQWAPTDGRPRVVFASRWSPDKDSAIQLAVARDAGGGGRRPGRRRRSGLGPAGRRGARRSGSGWCRAATTRATCGCWPARTSSSGSRPGILAASELEALAHGRAAGRCRCRCRCTAVVAAVLGGSVADGTAAIVSLAGRQ